MICVYLRNKFPKNIFKGSLFNVNDSLVSKEKGEKNERKVKWIRQDERIEKER